MRSHHLGRIGELELGQHVSVSGWVQHRRDHGGVVFYDLRDRYGLLQVVCDDALAERARRVSLESVIQVSGEIRARSDETVNDKEALGRIELNAQTLRVLSRAQTLPIDLEQSDTKEEVRLHYRYLDLRRPEMQRNLKLRAEMIWAMRRFLQQHDFWDIETPFLTRSTPEGARDYLVPSRVYPGHFFALPQSPQMFKQLLMIAGMDRYYQIVRCFRDEDLRADRQPEFTQLDVEMSFVTQAQVMELMEAMVCSVFEQTHKGSLERPFNKISYQQAMQRYGTDRPDLRNPLELCDVSSMMQDCDFKVFSQAAQRSDGIVVVLRVPEGTRNIGRQQIDRYTQMMQKMGAAGLAYIRVEGLTRNELKSPIVKFLSDSILTELLERCGAQPQDLLFFGAGVRDRVYATMDRLRQSLGQDLKLIQDHWSFVWVTDFPLFERDASGHGLTSVHHPFTAPKAWQQPAESMVAQAYDLVLNGVEIGGGSIRIHDAAMQMQVFEALGFSQAQAQTQFGFLLDALKYGAPPHGGMAFGLDRLAAMMAGCASIREVIAFPKTQRSSCSLTGAPDRIESSQLRELGIQPRPR